MNIIGIPEPPTLQDVAKSLLDKFGRNIEADALAEEEREAAETWTLAVYNTPGSTIRREFEPCVLECIAPVENVDIEGLYLTSRLVQVITDLAKWRGRWESSTPGERLDKAKNGKECPNIV